MKNIQIVGVFIGLLALAACEEDANTSIESGSEQEVALVRSIFETLQPISIQQGIEYCGVIGFDEAGALVASEAVPGDQSSCFVEDDGPVVVLTASYHTHGAFLTDYSSEVPSDADVEGDEAEGIDGYVATPGGRLWFVDSSERVLSQLCGLGCLPSDPNFIEGDDGEVAVSYTYEELFRRLEE